MGAGSRAATAAVSAPGRSSTPMLTPPGAETGMRKKSASAGVPPGGWAGIDPARARTATTGAARAAARRAAERGACASSHIPSGWPASSASPDAIATVTRRIGSSTRRAARRAPTTRATIARIAARLLVRVARSRQDVERTAQQGPLLVHSLVLAPPERTPAIAVDGGRRDTWPIRAPKVRDRRIGGSHPDKGAPTHRDRPSHRRTPGDVRRYREDPSVARDRACPAAASVRGAVSPGACSAPVVRSRDEPRRAPRPRTPAPHPARRRS